MRTFGQMLPMTYTFKAIHHYMATGTVATELLGTSLALNLLYFGAALAFLGCMFNKAKQLGLSLLELD